MTLQQRGDDLLGLGRRAAALEAEPHQVHAEQARRLGLLAGVQRLVADHDPVFVHPVLEAPEPPRPAAEHRERLVHLGNVEVLAAQEGLRRVREPRGAEERLALVGRPVAVLREQRVAVSRVRTENDEGVAARVEHRRPPARAHVRPRRFAGRRTARFAARAAGFFSSSSSFRTSISATIPCTSVRAPVWKYALWKTSTSSSLVAPRLDGAPHVVFEAGQIAADRHRRHHDHLPELRRQLALAHRGQLVDPLIGLEEVDVHLGHGPEPVRHEAPAPLSPLHDRFPSVHSGLLEGVTHSEHVVGSRAADQPDPV